MRKLVNVAVGSFASFRPSADHFRSTPINGHHLTGPVGPFRATTGLMHRSKNGKSFRLLATRCVLIN
jgi:hypothetical protein